jgi:hypothetical protein
MHFFSPALHLTAFSQQEGQIGHPILGIFWVILAFPYHQPMLLLPRIFLSPLATPGGMDLMVLLQDLKHP